jgi:hypothetical protein
MSLVTARRLKLLKSKLVKLGPAFGNPLERESFYWNHLLREVEQGAIFRCVNFKNGLKNGDSFEPDVVSAFATIILVISQHNVVQISQNIFKKEIFFQQLGVTLELSLVVSLLRVVNNQRVLNFWCSILLRNSVRC